MIRHVSMFKLKPGGSEAQLRAGLEAVRALVPGIVAYSYGKDAGLREGNWDLACVADFEDEQAFAAWDKHEEHARVRRDVTGPEIESAQRVQFRM